MITGGAAVMPGMVELGEDIFLKPVRKGVPTYRGRALRHGRRNPRSATVMGLLEEARVRAHARPQGRGAGGLGEDVFGEAKDWFLGNF